MGYYDSYNPDLLRFIPPDAKTVLEIGCGEGALCEAYRRVNPGVRWYGVECEREAGDKAWKPGRLDSVLEVEIEGYLALNGTLAEQSDVLILGDILEHLKDPWAVLRRLVGEVNPGGQVLASIPNVQHWTVIRDLLDGKWEYTDSGLMDRTHLRFFTLDSIRKMFADAGLQVFEIVGRDLFNEGIIDFLNGWLDGNWSPPNASDDWEKKLRAYQYVVRAIKPQRNSAGDVEVMRNFGEKITLGDPYPIDKLHIHAVTAEACCARPRILEPFAMLGTIPGVKCTAWPNALPETSRPEIWIQQRERDFDMDRQQTLFGLASIIIAEVDDLPEAIGMDPMALRAVHAIQCSTEALADVCRQYNPNVMVFENQIAELPPLDRVKKLPQDDTVRIFFGAQNRQADWAQIMPALNRVLADHPGILVCVVHDREFYDALVTGPNDSHKEFHPFCEYAEYRRLLGRCDIALLPLEDTPFNRCKSDIKFLECAAEGVAVLASPHVYSRKLMQWKETDYEPKPIGGIIYWYPGWKADCKSFENQLRELIKRPERRQWLAKEGYAYVRDNRLLSQHYRKQFHWYLDLLSQKVTLNAELFDRCPELTRVATS